MACCNLDTATEFSDSSGQKAYSITHTISCSTSGVVYHATCPCGLIYGGLTSRELRRRIREHALGIEAAKQVSSIFELKTIPQHFKEFHGCDYKLLRFKGIDRVLYNKRGGDWKKILAQKEARWIHTLNTVTPNGHNECLSFVLFLG